MVDSSGGIKYESEENGGELSVYMLVVGYSVIIIAGTIHYQMD